MSVPSFRMMSITSIRRYRLLNLHVTLHIHQVLQNLIYCLPYGLAFVSFEAQGVAHLVLCMEVSF
jgi:hypothetical protein